MYCSNCDTPVGATDQFCSRCGRRLSTESAPVPDTTNAGPVNTQGNDDPAGTPNQDRLLEASHASIVPQESWPPTELARAWPRYWARLFDLLFEYAAALFLFGLLAPRVYADVRTSFNNPQGLTVVMLPIAMLLDAVIYGAFGNTPGKWLAGIRVLDFRGQKIGFFCYLRRNWKVYVFGLAIGISIIALLTLAKNHQKVKAHGQTSWDSELWTRVFQVKRGYWRTYATAGTYILIFTSLLALGIASKSAKFSVEQQLQFAAQEVNKKAPYMLDANTRLDGAEVLPGRTFQYDYAIVEMSGETLDRGRLAAALQGSFQRSLVKRACASLKGMLDSGATVRYNYRDSGGAEIGFVAVTSQDCATQSTRRAE